MLHCLRWARALAHEQEKTTLNFAFQDSKINVKHHVTLLGFDSSFFEDYHAARKKATFLLNHDQAIAESFWLVAFVANFLSYN
jgi:hypothetical protein